MKNIFKRMLIAVSIIFIPIFVLSRNDALITADPFPNESTGQYIYYHDLRQGVYGSKEPSNRLVGLLKADNKQYIIRILNLKDGKSYLFLGRFILNNGNMEFTPESIQGDARAGAILLADLLNMMKYLSDESLKYYPKSKNKKDLTAPSIWKSYNRKYINTYKWWLPFYKLESCMNSESDSYGEKNAFSLKLVCFGSVSRDDPDMFTRINKLPVFYKEKISEKKFFFSPAEMINVKLDNVTLKLDKNWFFEKGNIDAGISDTYLLKKFTKRDAQVGVESIALNNIKLEKNEIETFASTLQFQSCVITDTVNIDLKNKTLSLSLWDTDSGTATFTKYISLGVIKNQLTMINFSALDFVYYSNTEYFDSILNTNLNN